MRYLATLVAATLLGLASLGAHAQTAATPASPYVTPAYGTDPAHQHKAYAPAKYGVSCLGDRVVWVNTASGVYHLEGERWFGRTKVGQYECERDAKAEGDRETRNGQ